MRAPLPALLSALALAAVGAGCVEFNTECSPPIDDPDRVVAWLAEPVPVARSEVRTSESALGNAIADAYLAALKGAPEFSPVAAFENAGAIRDLGLCVTRTHLQKGPLQRHVLRETLPFSNELVTLRLTEKELFQVLEHGVATLAVPGLPPAGQLLQVSGLSYTVDCSEPPEAMGAGGSRVRSVSFGGRTIERKDAGEGSVLVAMSSYIAGGGDGFIVLKGKADTARRSGRFSYAVAEEHLGKLGPSQQQPARLASDPENPRIVLTNCE